MAYPYRRLIKPRLGTPIIKGHRLGPAGGLVAYWLHEGAGSTVQDSSGNGNVGTLVADTHWVSGKFGPALSLDGTGDYITTPFNGTEFAQLNLSFWAKAGELAATSERYVLDNSLGATGFIIRINNATSDMHVYVYLDNAGLKNVSLTIPDTGWHFYSVTIGSTSLEISIDAGVPVTSAYALDTIKDSAQTMTIGNDSEDGGDDWKGELDNIMIHNRDLSTFEKVKLFQEPFCTFQDPNEWAVLGGYTTPVVGNAGIMTPWGGYWGPTY